MGIEPCWLSTYHVAPVDAGIERTTDSRPAIGLHQAVPRMLTQVSDTSLDGGITRESIIDFALVFVLTLLIWVS